MKSITAQRARQIDQAAQKDFGIPSIVLMENAGKSVFEVILARLPYGQHLSVAVFCGKGNNGGDGLVCARYLHNSGVPTSIYVLGSPSAMKRDPKTNLDILARMKARVMFIEEKKQLRKTFKKCSADIFVDALFGIGFSGKVEGAAFNLIDFINANDAMTISVDVPSGLNATTGKVENICVRAHTTVTFGLPKKGLYCNSGPRYAGEVIVNGIGFPNVLLK